eukprot:4313126-Amphidinium_carterae.2
MLRELTADLEITQCAAVDTSSSSERLTTGRPLIPLGLGGGSYYRYGQTMRTFLGVSLSKADQRPRNP